MATQVVSDAATTCSVCGAPLNGKGECVACLLRAGLDKSAIETKPDTSFVFGHYEVLEEIGRGGQAVVYRARQKSLNRIVALKVIGLGHWESTPHLKRFRHEAEAAASLEHPQIVPIYEIGESDGSCYFSMKFVEGGPLAEVLKHDPMSTRRAAELLAKIARTVHYAHQHGILHRDIKPGNILLDRQGEPHLTDFGLARLLEQESTITHSSDVLGTPSYMSPEQAAGRTKELTAAADVYSLGAVFYQMLTGEPPFAGGTTYETIRLVLESEPRNPRVRNPKIDRELSTICLKCLEKDPKRRYTSALALAEDLEHWLRREPIHARRTGLFGRGKKWVRRNPSIAVMAALLLALAVPLGVMIWKGESKSSPASNPAPEKSIAVLPFENLSRDPDNAFFADGVQDEILTDLARIADLKVISRASVMQYKIGVARNLREIAQQLGVANVVEGSVQRSGNRVRVNAQLIDARTDRHLWAQTYERDLSDVFAIQGEIAKTIADQLQAKLSPSEKSDIEQPPTSDISAFSFYTHAKNLLLTSSGSSTVKADLQQAVDLLNQAVSRDPSFFDAYHQLARAHDNLYFFAFDHTPARLALAEIAVNAAFRLRPDAGQAHLARAEHLYHGYLDYSGALAELETARQTLPNDSRLFELKGYIERRQGRWKDAVEDLNRAIELDPRNVLTLQQTAQTYQSHRHYAEEKSMLDRVLAFEPKDAVTKVQEAFGELNSKADTRPLRQTVDSIQASNRAAVPSIAGNWLICALAERDAAAANDALSALGDNPITFDVVENILFNRQFVGAVIARMTKDDDKARSAFTAARAEQEKIVQAQPNYGPAVCVLGLIDAGLGRKEQALREGRRAVELLPVEKDAKGGPQMIKYLAMIAAWVGDKDLACEQLAITVRNPSGLSYGQLKLLPFWDPLRGDPRFEKLVEEAKQPVALSASTSGATGTANFAPVPEKSIAVLPFENLSNDREDASFADGVQDDILTKLAKIADVKVISRTSVMQYRGKQNTRDIRNALRISHVLEGSVRKTGAWLHINAQLVDTRTDTTVWAEQYDRDVKEMFAVQSEITQKVAERLHAKISPAEKQAIQRPPTADIRAFDLYSRAKNLVLAWSFNFTEKANLLRAVDLMNQAVAHDPTFFQAYCQLAWVHDQLYQFRFDRTPERLALAQAAIETAFRLRPDSGEVHLARAGHLYRGYRDYEGALTELETAGQTMPNDSRLLELKGYIERRRPGGNQEEALRNLERAIELDPRNTYLLRQTALSYEDLRRYADEAAVTDRALAVDSNNAEIKAERAFAEFNWKADTRPLHQFIDSVRATNPVTLPDVADEWLICALAERDLAAAANALAVRSENSLGDELLYSPHFVRGLMARMTQDDARARSAFTSAREEQEKRVREHPDDPGALSVLGLIDAGLGRKEEALREGQRAVELVPMEKDAISGTRMIMGLARIAAWVGDKDLACEQLGRASRLPSRSVTYGRLKRMPWWDPLRGDPCFEQIVASLAPKEVQPRIDTNKR